jgi:hypothetical protein
MPRVAATEGCRHGHWSRDELDKWQAVLIWLWPGTNQKRYLDSSKRFRDETACRLMRHKPWRVTLRSVSVDPHARQHDSDYRDGTTLATALFGSGGWSDPWNYVVGSFVGGAIGAGTHRLQVTSPKT